MRLFAAHNAVWNASGDPQNPPVRVCVRAALWQSKMLTEIIGDRYEIARTWLLQRWKLRPLCALCQHIRGLLPL